MSYIILTESNCDLSPEMIKKWNIEVLPMPYTVDGKPYLGYPDGREMKIEEFYRLLREGKESKTAAPNPSDFVEIAEPFLKEGKDILYIAFSSGLSSTCINANMAAAELMEKYPERKFLVVDSLCASMGLGLLTVLACDKRDEGLSIEENAKWVEENKLHLCHWFTVNDLFHLKRGGRVSATSAILGSALGIKPVLHVDNEGHLIPVSKVRGRKQSLDGLVKMMAETVTDAKNGYVFISHGDCLEDAKYVEKQIKEKLGSKKFYINFIGTSIGTHSGPGTVALFFLGSQR